MDDKKRFLNLIAAALCSTGLLLAGTVSAQMPTSAQLQQLQQLSAAEQQRLARQLGIDLPASKQHSAPRLAEPVEPVEQNISLILAKEGEFSDIVEEPKVERFGHSLFNRNISTFAATDNNNVPDSYRLGVGDELVVQLYGKESETVTVQVGRDGQVVIPRLGPMVLAGLSFEAARDLLLQRVSEQLIGVDAVVSMGRLRAINIFMAGEVAVPGAFSVSALTTVTQALFQAGGISDIGSLRHIEVKRGGEKLGSFDLYDLLLRGDASGDLRLRSGDVVFVPPYQALAEITGAVKRPMFYELKGYETVDDLVAMAGGLTREAYTGVAALSRIDNATGLPTIETVSVGDIEVRRTAVRNGDKLRIFESGSELANVVTVEGAAYRSGDFGWRPGLRFSDLISDAQRDLLPTADLYYALIASEVGEDAQIKLTQFSIADALADVGSAADPILKSRDTLYIFAQPQLTELDSRLESGEETKEIQKQNQYSRQQLLQPVLEKLRRQARFGEPVQTVSVSGAVRAAGTYPFVEGATVADLIFAAGGLTQSAFTQSAELRRLESNGQGEVEADYREIDLSQALVDQAVTLQSRDHLNVRDIPDWSPTDSVRIEGEVRFPGTYLIEKGETLAELISRAGGATDEAFFAGAVFTREAIARKEREQAQQFARSIEKTYATSMLTEEQKDESLADIRAIAEQLQNFEGQGRLLIDLQAIMAGELERDIELTDGDVLVIPKAISTVTVVGEVQQPSSHLFNPKAKIKDYLALSAGLTKRADDRAIYVVKANGMVRPYQRGLFGKNRLEPGDTIVIPVDSAYKESLVAWKDITQIFYQSAVSIAAVLAL